MFFTIYIFILNFKSFTLKLIFYHPYLVYLYNVFLPSSTLKYSQLLNVIFYQVVKL